MLRHRDRNQSTFTVVQALPDLGKIGVWQVWVGGDAMPRARRQVAALRSLLPGKIFWVQAAIRP